MLTAWKAAHRSVSGHQGGYEMREIGEDLVTARLARRLRRLAGLVRGHARRCGCPACDPAEREARIAIGMPARHPERVTAELPGGQEEWLAALASQLWPDGDYTAIITELWHRDRP